MALTKQHTADSLYDPSGFSRNKSVKLTESLLELVESRRESGEDALITGFGGFCLTEENERMGRNPQTGETLILLPRRIVVFKCSSVLRDRINGKD